MLEHKSLKKDFYCYSSYDFGDITCYLWMLHGREQKRRNMGTTKISKSYLLL